MTPTALEPRFTDYNLQGLLSFPASRNGVHSIQAALRVPAHPPGPRHRFPLLARVGGTETARARPGAETHDVGRQRHCSGAEDQGETAEV